MKRIIAIILALSMLFAFVACDRNNDDNPTEPSTEDSAVNSGDVEQESSTDEDVSDEELSTEDNSNDENPTDKNDKNDKNDKETETTTNKPRPADPAEWSKAEIVEFYKQSAVKTHPTVKSSQTMKLNKLVVNDGDGALNFFINIMKPVIDTVIKNNATTYNGLTGGFTKLQPSDVQSAKAYKQGNYTIVEMTMVEQTDGIYGDAQEGTVGHAINVLGNVATAVEQFPDFDIKYEEADIKIHYTNPTVKVKINEKGIVEKGTWSYNAVIAIKSLDISGIMVNKADAELAYVIVVGGGF